MTKNKIAAFSTTVPVEVILAAGYVPLDLNNIFVTSKEPAEMVEQAELKGFARSSCSWIKGLYSVLTTPEFNKDICIFIAVSEGDCSNAEVLEEIVSMETGIRSFIFDFPRSRNIEKISNEIDRLADFLGTDRATCDAVWRRLKSLRKKLKFIDDFSYQNPGVVSGKENSLFLLCSTDFFGDPDSYEAKVDDFIKEIKCRKLCRRSLKKKKIGYLGVPPIVPIYDFLEERGATVIYNEIQREFAMLDSCENMAEQYVNYSYPYSASFRFEKALVEIKKRNLDGIIHYVQSFCHRQLEDIILRKALEEQGVEIPLLTIEFDKPLLKIDSRVATRIEAFLETI